MAIEIKELIIRINVDDSPPLRQDVKQNQLKPELSNEMIDECVNRVIEKLSRKITSMER